MLNITLIAVGEKPPGWVVQGYGEYAKRIRGRMRLNLIEIAAVRRRKNADMPRIMGNEEARILDAVPHGAHLVALERKGRLCNTPALAELLREYMDNGEQLALVIGGPEGLSESFINNAHRCWSLSALTFAHHLVRVMVAEQLYRCHSLLQGSPYHR